MRHMLWPDVLWARLCHHRTHLCARFIKRNHLKAFISRAYSSRSMVSLALPLKFKQMEKTWELYSTYLFLFFFFFKVIIWLKLPNTFSSFHFLHENVEELAALSQPQVRRDACHSTGLHLLPVRDWVLWLYFFSLRCICECVQQTLVKTQGPFRSWLQ